MHDYSRFSYHVKQEWTVRKTQMVTDRELEIMKVLWARGQASVREVQEDLNRISRSGRLQHRADLAQHHGR